MSDSFMQKRLNQHLIVLWKIKLSKIYKMLVYKNQQYDDDYEPTDEEMMSSFGTKNGMTDYE